MSETIYIGLGSNLCSPPQQLRRALHALRSLRHIRLTGISPGYYNAALTKSPPQHQLPSQTSPQIQAWQPPQPRYLNAVAALQSSLTPNALLTILQEIEDRQGRTRSRELWAARTLDIDLLLYGDLCLDRPELQLPHPRMLKRDFVLQPLFDLNPELVLPNGLPIREALQRLPYRCDLQACTIDLSTACAA